ncbi:MAG: phage major capsid protein [Christensenellaceae bacterium]|nr:phage major capsid protein [Christensenellaceae bacterium]
MITIATAENALKNIYLESVIYDINKKTNPFLTMIEENTKTASGRNARIAIRCGNSAIGVGTETGALPTGNTDKQIDVSVPLKNLYGTFQISDKALKSASIDPNAFSSLLSGEMENLVSAARNNLTTMLYGNGKQLLAAFNVTDFNSGRTVIQLNAKNIGNFSNGLSVAIYGANGIKVNSASTTISAVSTSSNTITLSTALPANKNDRFYIYRSNDDGSFMNGIDSVFENMPYGLNLDANPELSPYKYSEGSSDLKILNEEEVMDFFTRYEEHCQSMPADIILTSSTVKKAIFESLRNTHSNISVTELAGGFKGFTFNGIPVYSDIKCKGGTLYALNSNSFAIHQLGDWDWIKDDNGSFLHQIAGTPTYGATLTRYCDLICDKPFLQGKCSNYSANKWKD